MDSTSKPFFWGNAFAAVPVICFGFQVGSCKYVCTIYFFIMGIAKGGLSVGFVVFVVSGRLVVSVGLVVSVVLVGFVVSVGVCCVCWGLLCPLGLLRLLGLLSVSVGFVMSVGFCCAC